MTRRRLGLLSQLLIHQLSHMLVDFCRVVAGGLAGRMQCLVIEERGQFVILLREAGFLVERPFVAECLVADL